METVKLTFNPSVLPDFLVSLKQWKQLEIIEEGDGFIIVSGETGLIDCVLHYLGDYITRYSAKYPEDYKYEYITEEVVKSEF